AAGGRRGAGAPAGKRRPRARHAGRASPRRRRRGPAAPGAVEPDRQRDQVLAGRRHRPRRHPGERPARPLLRRGFRPRRAAERAASHLREVLPARSRRALGLDVPRRDPARDGRRSRRSQDRYDRVTGSVLHPGNSGYAGRERFGTLTGGRAVRTTGEWTMHTRHNLAARAGRWSAAHWKTATLLWIAFVVVAVLIGRAAGT